MSNLNDVFLKAVNSVTNVAANAGGGAVSPGQDDPQGDRLAKLQKGTLTHVPGDIVRAQPGNMKIQTPTDMLGVRG